MSEVLGCCGGAGRSGQCSGLGTPWCGWAPPRGAGRCWSHGAGAVWGRGARSTRSGGAEGRGAVPGAGVPCGAGVRPAARYIRAGAEAAVARCCHGNQHGDVVGWVAGGQAGPRGLRAPGGVLGPAWAARTLGHPRPGCPPLSPGSRPDPAVGAGLRGAAWGGGLGQPLALHPPCPSLGDGGPRAGPAASLFAWQFSLLCTLPRARGFRQRGAGRLAASARGCYVTGTSLGAFGKTGPERSALPRADSPSCSDTGRGPPAAASLPPLRRGTGRDPREEPVGSGPAVGAAVPAPHRSAGTSGSARLGITCSAGGFASQPARSSCR